MDDPSILVRTFYPIHITMLLIEVVCRHQIPYHPYYKTSLCIQHRLHYDQRILDGSICLSLPFLIVLLVFDLYDNITVYEI